MRAAIYDWTGVGTHVESSGSSYGQSSSPIEYAGQMRRHQCNGLTGFIGWIRGANLRRGQLFEADPTNKEPFA